MNFLNLPPEIMILIIKQLDLKSKLNLYHCCDEVKKHFSACHVKSVVLSKTSISRKIFQQDLFVKLGAYVQELNLSGLPDFTAATFRQHCHLFNNLKSLDITFTDIYLCDLPGICPETLKVLAMNFFQDPREVMQQDIWQMCIDLFKEHMFQKIHFIVDDILDSDTPLLFLKHIDHIDSVRVTVADKDQYYTDLDEDEMPEYLRRGDELEVNFSELSFIARDCLVLQQMPLTWLRGIVGLNFQQIEYIFIMYCQEKITIYVSSLLESIFLAQCSHVTVNISPNLPRDFWLEGNMVFHAWNKSKVIFDDDFFKRLHEQIRVYFPTYVCLCKANNIRTPVTNAGVSGWYCIDSSSGFETKLDNLPQKVTLTKICRKKNAVGPMLKPTSLSSGSESLKNITFLRLSNINVRQDFFTVLFKECSKLDTLDIELKERDRVDAFRLYISSLAAAIEFTKSLKNVKLTTSYIDYEQLFATLSRCLTLENVHVRDEYGRCTNVNANSNLFSMFAHLQRLIEQCKDLYSLFFETDHNVTFNLMKSLLTELRSKVSLMSGRDNLAIEVRKLYEDYNPFDDVFNPSPLYILN